MLKLFFFMFFKSCLYQAVIMLTSCVVFFYYDYVLWLNVVLKTSQLDIDIDGRKTFLLKRLQLTAKETSV